MKTFMMIVAKTPKWNAEKKLISSVRIQMTTYEGYAIGAKDISFAIKKMDRMNKDTRNIIKMKGEVENKEMAYKMLMRRGINAQSIKTIDS